MKIILFAYIGGAGGKFIANCLSMSGHVAFSNFEIATAFAQNQDFEILKEALLDTIPPKNQSRTWFQREQGCFQLFGPAIKDIRNTGSSLDKLKDLDSLGDVWLPLMSNGVKETQNFLKYFSQHTVKTVLVNGTKEFINKSIRLKWPEKHHCLDLEIYNRFQSETKKINFDYVIQDWNPLIPDNWIKVEKLSNMLDIEFDMSCAKFYTDKYLNFYQ